MGARVWVMVMAGLLASGCDTDVDSPFTNVSAGGTGQSTPDTDTSTSTSMGSGSTETTDGSAGAETTAAESTGSPGTTETTGSDPCVPDPCTAPEVCVDGVCMGASAPTPGDVVVTEFHPNPAIVSDEAGEWLELHNTAAVAVDLGGCELADQGSDDHTIAGSLVIEAGGYAVLGRSDAGNGGVVLDYAYGGDISLGNDGDELIVRCAGVVVDELVYLPSWPYDNGAAAQLDPAAGAANDDVMQWCEATATYGDGDLGTPGTANNPC